MEKPCGFDYNHEWDNPDCPKCWMYYPRDCKCGGLIHAEFFETNFDDDVWLSYWCSKCGEDYEEAED